jgi:hypothetical protein
MPTDWHDLPADQIVHDNGRCWYCQGESSLRKTKALQPLRTRYGEMIGALKDLDKRVDHVKEAWSPGRPRYDFSHISDGSYDPEHPKHYYVVQLKLLGYCLNRWCDLKECIAFELERSYWAARETLRNEMSPEHQNLPTTTDGGGDT